MPICICIMFININTKAVYWNLSLEIILQYSRNLSTAEHLKENYNVSTFFNVLILVAL